MPESVYRIVDWEKHFENNRTRELKSLGWVPIPNKHDGDGYTQVMEEDDGAAIYGAWISIVQVASKCDTRGVLMRDASRPHDARSLSRMTRVPITNIQRALDKCVSIGWLETETVTVNCDMTIPQAGAVMSHSDAVAPQEGALKEGKGMELNGMEKKDAPPKGGCPPDLKPWIDWWNRLRADSLVSSSLDDDPPSQALIKSWGRAQKSAECRALLRRQDEIETAVRESPFCREGWFRLEKLFGGTNRDGTLIIKKLLDGGYADVKRDRQPGVNYDPNAADATF